MKDILILEILTCDSSYVPKHQRLKQMEVFKSVNRTFHIENDLIVHVWLMVVDAIILIVKDFLYKNRWVYQLNTN